jgi:predicted nuclease with RNAse H fold
MNEVGIDLAGVKERKTGFALLNGLEVKTKVLFSDRAIIKAVKLANPSIVSIDAPLSKPLHGKMRICEKQLVKMKIRVFPCLFTQMVKLTERGIKLAQALSNLGFVVIESYPGSAQDILGIPRKGKSLHLLQEGLVKYGITGDVLKYGVTDHELDAITSAIVGKLHLEGKTLSIGKKEEGLMVIPKRPNNPILE